MQEAKASLVKAVPLCKPQAETGQAAKALSRLLLGQDKAAASPQGIENTPMRETAPGEAGGKLGSEQAEALPNPSRSSSRPAVSADAVGEASGTLTTAPPAAEGAETTSPQGSAPPATNCSSSSCASPGRLPRLASRGSGPQTFIGLPQVSSPRSSGLGLWPREDAKPCGGTEGPAGRHANEKILSPGSLDHRASLPPGKWDLNGTAPGKSALAAEKVPPGNWQTPTVSKAPEETEVQCLPPGNWGGPHPGKAAEDLQAREPSMPPGKWAAVHMPARELPSTASDSPTPGNWAHMQASSLKSPSQDAFIPPGAWAGGCRDPAEEGPEKAQAQSLPPGSWMAPDNALGGAHPQLDLPPGNWALPGGGKKSDLSDDKAQPSEPPAVQVCAAPFGLTTDCAM